MKVSIKIFLATFSISMSVMLCISLSNSTAGNQVYGASDSCAINTCWTAGAGGNCAASGPSSWFDCPGLISATATSAPTGACGNGFTVQTTAPSPDDALRTLRGKQATVVNSNCMIWIYGTCIYTSSPNEGSSPLTYTVSCVRNTNATTTGTNGNRLMGTGDPCS